MAAIFVALVLAAAQAVAQPPAPAVQAVASARVWEGRAAEFETALKNTPVVRITELEIGVTRPKRAFTAPGSLVESFAWKPLKPGRYRGYWESYKSEIAAYELDKLIGLDMVPPVVERRIDGETGAAVLWLRHVRSWQTILPLPKPATWGYTLARMKMFDDLIGNDDRNEGNLLVDEGWSLFLIDHSRAFSRDRALPFELQHIDRRLWQRMATLNDAVLTTNLGPWLDREQIRALLERRDRMRQAIDALVAKYGDKVFF
jgi:hypothetical protein